MSIISQNRKVRYDKDGNPVGLSDVIISEKNTTPRSSPKRKTSNVFVYPSARDIREYEDSFMIKAIEYVVPGEGDGIGASISGNMDALLASQSYTKKQQGEFWDAAKASGVNQEQWANPEFRSKWLIEQQFRPNTADIAQGLRVDFQNEDKTEIIEKRGHNLITKYFVELPIPQQVSDTSSVSWGDETINIFEMAGLALGKGIIDRGLDIPFNKIQAVVRAMTMGMDLNLDDGVSDAVKAALTGRALNAFNSNLDTDSVLARSTGQILNSNLELLFKGVNLRSFPFTVTFSPRNPKEAGVVRDIIRKLKQSMSARRKVQSSTISGQAKLFLSSPDLFLLRYLKNGKDHPFLNSFKPCALTQLNVNYTGAGTYSTYGDSTPTNIEMRMVFKEINPIYAEDYEEAAAGPGVGF
tara:strand:- start:664 stop:1896 length:1233 start_codon:yes stop_codon:yes gene_type:complete